MPRKSSDSCCGRRHALWFNVMEDSSRRRRRVHLAVLLCGLVLLTFAERRLAELDFDPTGVVRIENNDKPDGDEIINRLVLSTTRLNPSRLRSAMPVTPRTFRSNRAR